MKNPGYCHPTTSSRTCSSAGTRWLLGLPQQLALDDGAPILETSWLATWWTRVSGGFCLCHPMSSHACTFCPVHLISFTSPTSLYSLYMQQHAVSARIKQTLSQARPTLLSWKNTMKPAQACGCGKLIEVFLSRSWCNVSEFFNRNTRYF